MFPADDIADVEGGVVWAVVTLPQAEAGVPNPLLALFEGGVVSAEWTSC